MPNASTKTIFASLRSKLATIFSLDLRSLATFRIALGLLIILDLMLRFSDIGSFYSDSGVLPRSSLWGDVYKYGFSVYLLNGSWIFQVFLFLLTAFFAFLLVIGYRTWLATFITWILLASLHNRNPFILGGGDDLLISILFWSLFLPLGAKYSLDSLRRTVTELPKTIFNAATIAYFLQILFLYLFAAIHKSAPAWRVEGTAVLYALHHVRYSTAIGAWMLNFPEFLKISSFGVLIFEFIGPFFLLFPYKTQIVRLITICLFLGMHLVFGLAMNLNIFSHVVIVAFIPLIPGIFWDKLLAFLKNPQRSGLQIYYDYECGFCKLACKGIKTFFLIPETKILSAQDYPKIQKEMNDNDSWVIKDFTGKSYYQFEAFVPIFKASPLLWPFTPLLHLPFVQKIGRFLYKRVSAKRKDIFCEIPSMKSSKNFIPNLKLNKFVSMTVIVFISLVFLWNLGTLRKFNYINSIQPFRHFMFLTRLRQQWALFAPEPGDNNVWMFYTGKLQDGTQINLSDSKKPISFEKPPLGSIPFKNSRWMKYHGTLFHNRRANLISQVKFFCRQWNQKLPKPKVRLEDVELHMLSQRISLKGEINPIQNNTSSYQCKTFGL